MHTKMQVCYTSVQCISCVLWISILSIPQGLISLISLLLISSLFLSVWIVLYLQQINSRLYAKSQQKKPVWKLCVLQSGVQIYILVKPVARSISHRAVPRWRCLLGMKDHCGSNRFHLLSALSCSQSCHSVLLRSLSLAVCFLHFIYYFTSNLYSFPISVFFILFKFSKFLLAFWCTQCQECVFLIDLKW
jgi:hypothetical protein